MNVVHLLIEKGANLMAESKVSDLLSFSLDIVGNTNEKAKRAEILNASVERENK